MDFPEQIELKDLLTCHPDYQGEAQLYERIEDLCVGGWRLEKKKRQYLPQRPGEDDKLYNTRIKRFTYTNVLGESLSKQVAKLASGSIDVDDADSPDWAQFRQGNDRLGRRSEMALLQEIFRSILKFGGCYLHIEKSATDSEPQNRLQEQLLGSKTYVCLYQRSEVTNWGEDDGDLDWIKIQQIKTETDPFGKTKHEACWTFITQDSIACYEAYVKMRDGVIIGLDRGDEQLSSEPEFVPLDKIVPHGFGRIPVVEVDAAIDMWVCYGSYLIAQQALDLENSRYDVGAMSYIQRTYKPIMRPDMDLDETFTEDEPISSNAHIIKADTFQFNEAGGATIEKLGDYVGQLHDQIQQAFGQFGASSNQSPQRQSGLSKQMDYVIQEIILISYGALLVDTYSRVLELVAIALGTPSQVPSVSGFDSFDIDSLETLVAIAKDLGSIHKYLPPTAIKLFAKQLAGLLTRRVTGRQQTEIDREIEEMFLAGKFEYAEPAPAIGSVQSDDRDADSE